MGVLSRLKSRGIRGVCMFTDDKATGMVGSIADVFPGVAYQRCAFHFYRNVLARVPKINRPRVAAMPEAIYPLEPRGAFEAEALEVADELETARIEEAARVDREGCAETLTYTKFPREYWL